MHQLLQTGVERVGIVAAFPEHWMSPLVGNGHSSHQITSSPDMLAFRKNYCRKSHGLGEKE